MESRPPYARPNRVTHLACWVVVIALAIFFRAGAIQADLPYIGYVDEGHVLHQAVNLLQYSTYDTGFYNYPSLPSYLIATVVLAYAPVHQALYGKSFWDEFQAEGGPIEWYYDFLVPVEFIICGRAVAVLLSLGAVILAGVFGTRLAGPWAGVLAGLFAAVCPALVSRGAIVIVDTFSTFFTLAALLFCHRLQARESVATGWHFALLTGVMSGCAFTCKYTVGAVFLALLVTVALLRTSLKTRILLAMIGGAGFVAGSILTMPLLVTRFSKIVETIRGIASFYNTVPSKPGYFGAAITSEELGVPLVTVGVIGLLFMIWRDRDSRSTALSWLAFAALLIGALIRSDFQPLRNLLPLVPLVCLAAAVLITRAHEYVRKDSHRVLAAAAGMVVAFLTAISLLLPTWQHWTTRVSHVDTRVAAIDWLRQNTKAGDRILALEELAILPAEWKRLPSAPTLITWPSAVALLQKEHFDYVIGSEFELRFVGNAQGPARYVKRWTAAVSSFPVAATFGFLPNLIVPGVWRSNDERIVIMRGAPTETAAP